LGIYRPANSVGKKKMACRAGCLSDTCTGCAGLRGALVALAPSVADCGWPRSTISVVVDLQLACRPCAIESPAFGHAQPTTRTNRGKNRRSALGRPLSSADSSQLVTFRRTVARVGLAPAAAPPAPIFQTPFNSSSAVEAVHLFFCLGYEGTVAHRPAGSGISPQNSVPRTLDAYSSLSNLE